MDKLKGGKQCVCSVVPNLQTPVFVCNHQQPSVIMTFQILQSSFQSLIFLLSYNLPFKDSFSSWRSKKLSSVICVSLSSPAQRFCVWVSTAEALPEGGSLVRILVASSPVTSPINQWAWSFLFWKNPTIWSLGVTGRTSVLDCWLMISGNYDHFLAEYLCCFMFIVKILCTNLVLTMLVLIATSCYY